MMEYPEMGIITMADVLDLLRTSIRCPYDSIVNGCFLIGFISKYQLIKTKPRTYLYLTLLSVDTACQRSVHVHQVPDKSFW